MIELLRVALRAVGVVCPGATVLGIVELRGGAPEGDYGSFLGAMAVSLLAAAVWSVLDARHGLTPRIALRWAATTVLVAGGLAVVSTLLAPGSPPEEKISEVVYSALFYGVPMLLAVGLGAAVGASSGEQST